MSRIPASEKPQRFPKVKGEVSIALTAMAINARTFVNAISENIISVSDAQSRSSRLPSSASTLLGFYCET